MQIEVNKQIKNIFILMENFSKILFLPQGQSLFRKESDNKNVGRNLPSKLRDPKKTLHFFIRLQLQQKTLS